MSTVYNENWDSVAPPALPANWNADATLVTTSTRAYTSPNSLSLNTSSGTTKIYATYGVVDGTGGTVATTSSRFYLATGSPVGLAAQVGVTFRCSASTMDNASTSCYWAYLLFDSSLLYSTLYLAKIVNGAVTNLASQQNNDQTINTNLWYEIACSVNSSTFDVSFKRMSDGYYMDSSGTFTSTTPTAAIPGATDSSIASGGYSGLCVVANRANRVFVDDGVISTGPLVLRPNDPVVAKLPFYYYHPE